MASPSARKGLLLGACSTAPERPRMDVSLAQRGPWSPGWRVPRKVAILPREVSFAARNYQKWPSGAFGTRSRCPTHGGTSGHAQPVDNARLAPRTSHGPPSPCPSPTVPRRHHSPLAGVVLYGALEGGEMCKCKAVLLRLWGSKKAVRIRSADLFFNGHYLLRALHPALESILYRPRKALTFALHVDMGVPMKTAA